MVRRGRKTSFGPKAQRSPKSLLHNPKLRFAPVTLGNCWNVASLNACKIGVRYSSGSSLAFPLGSSTYFLNLALASDKKSGPAAHLETEEEKKTTNRTPIPQRTWAGDLSCRGQRRRPPPSLRDEEEEGEKKGEQQQQMTKNGPAK